MAAILRLQAHLSPSVTRFASGVASLPQLAQHWLIKHPDSPVQINDFAIYASSSCAADASSPLDAPLSPVLPSRLSSFVGRSSPIPLPRRTMGADFWPGRRSAWSRRRLAFRI